MIRKAVMKDAEAVEEIYDRIHAEEEAGRTARKTDDVPSPTRAAAADALKVFTDEELIAALTERGWEGELTRIQRITIGRKE